MPNFHVSYVSPRSGSLNQVVAAEYYRHAEGWTTFKDANNKVVTDIRSDLIVEIRRLDPSPTVMTVNPRDDRDGEWQADRWNHPVTRQARLMARHTRYSTETIYAEGPDRPWKVINEIWRDGVLTEISTVTFTYDAQGKEVKREEAVEER